MIKVVSTVSKHDVIGSPLHVSPFFIIVDTEFGRGLIAAKDIREREIIEISPYLRINSHDSRCMDATVIESYRFLIDGENILGDTCLALGYGSLFNHSEEPNVDYDIDPSRSIIEYVTLRDIEKGEQLFIDYGYDPAAP